MPSEPNVSLIVNTYNRPDTLVDAIGALARQSGIDDGTTEIVVIDDGSTVDNESALRETGLRNRVRYRRIEHAGRAEARNRGLAMARGEWIVFLGDDIIAEPDLVAAHMRLLSEAPDRKRMSLGHNDWMAAGRSMHFQRAAAAHNFEGLEAGQTLDFRYFYTANVALPRRALDEVGGFDSSFSTYGWEDADLGLRLEHAGWRLIYNPAARAVHRHPPAGIRDFCRRQTEIARAGCRLFAMRKDYGPEVENAAFWPGTREMRPGPDWRLNLGMLAAWILERAAPNSRLTAQTYLRLIVACRARGVRQGRKDFPEAGI